MSEIVDFVKSLEHDLMAHDHGISISNA